MIRIVIAVLGLVLPAVATPAPRADAAEPPVPGAEAVLGVNGAITFAGWGENGLWRIYRANADGTAATPLTTAFEAYEPAFSPSGREIAFSQDNGHGRSIYVMNEDGTGLNVVSGNGSHHNPAWSPDGEHVVFEDQPNRLHLASYYGGDHMVLHLPTGIADPSYLPDGRHVIFTTSTEDGLKEVIERLDLVTGAVVRLDWTETFEIDNPVYSPDGRFILYEGNLPHGAGIVRIAADGTEGPVLLAPGGADPTYSPDGRFILYTTNGYQNLYRMTANGADPTNITPPGDLLVREPSWGLLPCGGLEPTVMGTGGPDQLVGTPGPDVIDGLRGPDVIVGGGGADVICGGLGSDTVSYVGHELDVVVDLDGASGDDGSPEDGLPGLRDTIAGDVERVVGGYGDDRLTGGPGADLLIGGPGDDTLAGGAGNDSLTGSSGDDTLLGGGGNDVLRGLTGLDTLAGGEGDDVLDGGNDADGLNGGPGIDTATYASRTGGVTVTLGGVTGGDGNAVDGPVGHRDTVPVNVEWLVGGRGDDRLTGSAADNRLTGGLGADRLRGLAGADVLAARDGVADLLIDCGDGVDRAVIDSGIDPTPVSCP